MRTYKKQLNYVIVSSALVTADNLAVGVDSLAIGQTSITDANVPTGTRIRGFLIQLSITNPGTTSVEWGANVQYLLSGQAANVPPLAVGGNPQRNQVIKSWHGIIAQDSMTNLNVYVKLPKQFQRIKEGTLWRIVIDSSAAREQAIQVIYRARI